MTVAMFVALMAFAPAAVMAHASAVQPKTIEAAVYLHENPLHVAPERLAATAIDTIVLHVLNTGASEHNLLVCASADSSDCGGKVAFTGPMAPNATVTLNFTLTKGGNFDYYCTIPGHKAAGMRGTLEVVAVSSQATPGPGPLSLVGLGLALALFTSRRKG
jgi:nitrite reductase (NO-forming)